MKTLHEYLTEHMIAESFQSDILRDFWMGLQKSSRNSGSYFNMLAWDKITDDDLKKLTKEEALKRMRAQKNPGYLLWVSEKQFRYRERIHSPNKDEVYSYNGITWGWDVVMTYNGVFKGVKANHIAEDADYAYEVLDPQKFLVGDLQRSRREARRGATALMNPREILEKNLERYRQALAELHNPGIDEAIKMFNDAMDIYKNCIEKYVVKFSQMMQEGTGSYYDMALKFEQLNALATKLSDRLVIYRNYADKKGNQTWALRNYKEMSEAARKIEEIANKYFESAE